MKATVSVNGNTYEIELTEEQVKEIEKPKYKRWRADKRKTYFIMYVDGDVCEYTEFRDVTDNFSYSIGNYFETEEEAEEYKKKLLYLQQYKDYLGDDLVTEDDWKNPNIFKYKAYFDFDPLRGLGIRTSADCLMKYQGAIYSKSKEKIENFINLIGEDNFKKYILEVED